uniref:E3 ubiquitin ligase UBR4 C-terminal domain-containing protein n=1 Tax=Saimiri boliviensis boliviensis TaxID=39432 RepID=A0A2K6S5R8_SAIBB
MLEDMSTGTESETKAFMAVCIETGLCSIIYPEENEVTELLTYGRMPGKPYSSNEPGIRPLMRDIKNKVCQDCDLVTLLEDDSGMELLKIWCTTNEGEPIRTVYRMWGLLGNATEEFMKSLDSTTDEEEDEEVYNMAGVGAWNACLTDSLGSEISINRQQLVKLEMNTLNVMLRTLNLALEEESKDSGGAAVAEQIVLDESSAEPLSEEDKGNLLLTGDKDQLVMLLDQISSTFVHSNPSMLHGLPLIIPYLSFGEVEKVQILVERFKPGHDEVFLDCFCKIAAGIKNNSNEHQLKNLIVQKGITQNAPDYMKKHIGSAKNLDLLSRPALPFILRLLRGLAMEHLAIQVLIGTDFIPNLHKLEQVSSDEGIGTMAENLLEALREHPDVNKKIAAAHRETQVEKSMKALGTLGMTVNEKCQVITKTALLKQMEELINPASRATSAGRDTTWKEQGCSTVSHFNIVHHDCHLAAIRLALGQEAWESATLQNANTKGNALHSVWGPHVPESAFATCLAGHNTYLQECTGQREPTYQLNIHDIKQLFLRFAVEQPFSADTCRGGRESNMHLIAYVIHTVNSREEKNLQGFLEQPKKWEDSAFEVDGPHYFTVPALHVLPPPPPWRATRVEILRRLLVTSQAWAVAPGGATRLTDKAVKDYSMFKKVPTSNTEGGWSCSLAGDSRHNDMPSYEAADKALKTFQEEFMPVETFSEFLDVAEVTDPQSLLKSPLNWVP